MKKKNKNKNKNKLGTFLKVKRIEAGLTQLDISRALDYTSPQFISNWERGTSHPPIRLLVELCKMLKVNQDELFDLVLEVTIEDVTNDLKRKFARCKG
ncbi:helix-turn-helix domain-containing protein [Bdellovibrio sp. HCB2-146]|uniref:helix-turn-helix domain-containing protein n=1 Tax=Bdellovibrio sp. HCB2-146 TaxID=3394362 RepID=UPI0039BD2D44